MKAKSTSQSAFFYLRVLIGVLLVAGIFLTLVGVGAFSNAFAQGKTKGTTAPQARPWSALGDLRVAAPAPTSRTASRMNNNIEAPSPEPPLNCTWTAGPNLPTNILDNAVASLGSNLYSFTGVGNGALVT